MIENLPKYLLKQKTAIALVIAFVLLGAATSSPVSALKVTGVILEGTASPGGHANFDMSVSMNKNETPENLTIDIVDWKQALDGQNYVANRTSSSYSAGDILTVTPKSFFLKPNATQNVAVEADIPANAKPGGRYAIISLHRAAEETKSKSGVGVQVVINSLVRLTVSGEGIKQTGDISSLDMAKPVSSKQPEGFLIFNNTGNIHYKILTEETIKDKDDQVVAKASVPSDSSILPDAARLIKFTFNPTSPLQPGTYTLDANVSLEDGTALATKSTTFQL